MRTPQFWTCRVLSSVVLSTNGIRHVSSNQSWPHRQTGSHVCSMQGWPHRQTWPHRGRANPSLPCSWRSRFPPHCNMMALGFGFGHWELFWVLVFVSQTDLSNVRQLSTWSGCKTGIVGSRPQQPLHLDSRLSQIVLLHGGPATWACHSSPQVLCVCPAHLLGIPGNLCIAVNPLLPIHSLKLPSFTLTSCFPFFLGLTTLTTLLICFLV